MASTSFDARDSKELAARVRTAEGHIHNLTARDLRHFRVLAEMVHGFVKLTTSSTEGPHEKRKAEEFEDSNVIPLEKIKSESFQLVLHWVEHHKYDIDCDEDEDPVRSNRNGLRSEADYKNHEIPDIHELKYLNLVKTDKFDGIPEWDQNFLKNLSDGDFYDVMYVADYLDVRPLLIHCCKFLADKLRGKSVEEVRQMLEIQSDYTPEEEQRIRMQTDWTVNEEEPEAENYVEPAAEVAQQPE